MAYQPNAPQNNMGVSATGGAGSKDGQPNRYVSGGGEYGASKALNEQQAGASMVSAPTGTSATSAGRYDNINLPQLPSLFDASGKSEPISTGIDFGRGAGSEAMPKNLSNNTRVDENAKIAAQYLPDLAFAARSPNAPDSFKRFVNYLVENSQGSPLNG